MINAEQRQLLHQYLILDLAIQSLQRDYKILEQLKMKAIYVPFVESLMKSVRQDYFNLKRKLAKQKYMLSDGTASMHILVMCV